MSAPRTRLEFSDDGVATITLTRGEKGNALDFAACETLEANATAVAKHPGIKAVLLRSEGKAFCVGGDLPSFSVASDPAQQIYDMTAAAHRAVLTLRKIDAPLIVAVQGAAAGAGFSLAIGGDVVLAGRANASFTFAYTKVGLSGDFGVSWFLPRLIGMRRAQELALSNRRLSADEAVAMNLISEAVDDADLDSIAVNRARSVAAGSTLAFANFRRLLDSSFETSLEEQLHRECVEISELAKRPETITRFKDFAAKRRN